MAVPVKRCNTAQKMRDTQTERGIKILYANNIVEQGQRRKNIFLLFLFLFSVVNGYMSYIQYLF